MEAKIMKMAKKLLAVVLTGVMAVSMLTGCAGISSRRVADELQGMLKAVNDKATVSATNDAKKLAEQAAKAVQADTTEWVAPTDNSATTKKDTMEEAVKKSLKTDEITDKYVWYTCYKSEDVKNVAQAQEIYNLLVNEQKRINTAGALNNEKVTNKTEGNTTLKVSAGNKFELGLKTFTKGSGKYKTEYTVVIVTCKAVYSES